MSDPYTASLARHLQERANAQTADLGLFRTHPRHHTDDPETSIIAEIRAEEGAAHVRRVCLQDLEGVGQRGATGDEINARHGWEFPTAERRLGELYKDGLVTRGPDTRLNRKGNPCVIWRLA